MADYKNHPLNNKVIISQTAIREQLKNFWINHGIKTTFRFNSYGSYYGIINGNFTVVDFLKDYKEVEIITVNYVPITSHEVWI